jgi:hypothetical protein
MTSQTLTNRRDQMTGLTGGCTRRPRCQKNTVRPRVSRDR